MQLGTAADLDPARSPGIHPLKIVDDEGERGFASGSRHFFEPLSAPPPTSIASSSGPRRNPTRPTCGEPSRPTVANRLAAIKAAQQEGRVTASFTPIEILAVIESLAVGWSGTTMAFQAQDEAELERGRAAQRKAITEGLRRMLTDGVA